MLYSLEEHFNNQHISYTENRFRNLFVVFLFQIGFELFAFDCIDIHVMHFVVCGLKKDHFPTDLKV